MSNYSFQKNLKKKTITYIIILNLGVVCFLFSNVCAAADAFLEKKELTALQKEARLYRAQGLEQQKIGNLEAAMSSYQKAVEIDPAYAVAYNDLGIIYEAGGELDRAEDSYQKAVTVNPDYLSSYSNLALLYETKNDFERAVFYWRKRAELGLSKDPWTQKARERLAALMRMSPSYKKRVMEEQVTELNKKVAELKKLKKQNDLKKAKEHLGLAKKLYNSVEYGKAMSELKLALVLDPQEKEALSLMNTIKARLAEQEKKAREEKKKQDIKSMQAYFETGVKYYQQDNLQQAREEFAKIKELVAFPQKK